MKSPSKKLNCARKMPELRHSISSEEFDITKSEVVRWLIQQPDVLQYIFNRIVDNGTKTLIVYNSDKGTWKGIDYGN